jgi:hypothetical protein
MTELLANGGLVEAAQRPAEACTANRFGNW